MATDYEKIYKDQRHALGKPTSEIVLFFEQLAPPVRVLDVGCGQGRDALFIARLGHQVVGVDLSRSGITQLQEDAELEKLSIEGIVANVLDYEPQGLFNVILFDRTLHMLQPSDRIDVLHSYRKHVDRGGYLLINDEKKNLGPMETLFLEERDQWTVKKKTRGFLFLQKS